MLQETGTRTPHDRWPAHAAARNTHAQVLEVVRTHCGPLAGARVVDLPCGAGAFSRDLLGLGAAVISADIARNEPFLGDPGAWVRADANARLPFADGSVDAFVSIEGIEHFENPSFFLRECHRVLRPGGTLVLSTPNVDSFRSRRSMFTHGYHRYFNPVSAAARDSGHLHAIDMVFMRGLIRDLDLEVLEITVNRAKRRWYYDLLRPWLTRRLPRDMRGVVPFYGEVIIYALRKRG